MNAFVAKQRYCRTYIFIADFVVDKSNVEIVLLES